MSERDVAKAFQKLTQAQQAEALFQQAYTLANNSGIDETTRNKFKALFDVLSDHRSALQQVASDSLSD